MNSVFIATNVDRHWEAHRHYLATGKIELDNSGRPTDYARGRTYEECLEAISNIPQKWRT